MIAFEIFSDAELESIYDDFPMGLKKKQWFEVFAHCTEGEHNFLFYNIQKPKTMRIMKNFDKVCFFKEEKRTGEEFSEKEERPKKKIKV